MQFSISLVKFSKHSRWILAEVKHLDLSVGLVAGLLKAAMVTKKTLKRIVTVKKSMWTKRMKVAAMKSQLRRMKRLRKRIVRMKRVI